MNDACWLHTTAPPGYQAGPWGGGGRDAKAHLAVVAIHLVLQICDLYVLGLELGHDLVGLGVRLSVVVPISYNNVLAPRTTPPWPFDSATPSSALAFAGGHEPEPPHQTRAWAWYVGMRRDVCAACV